MAAEFSWWLLIVGVVAGGALTWLVLAEFARRDREISDEEVAAEASWIARTIDTPALDADLAEEVLRAHRRYLGFPPPDVLASPDELPALAEEGANAEPPPDTADLLPGVSPADLGLDRQADGDEGDFPNVAEDADEPERPRA
jgi:hypothetical protein